MSGDETSIDAARVCTGIFQVLATARTRKSGLGTRLHVKDYAHALNCGVEFKFEIKDILLRRWPLLVQAAKRHEPAPTARISGGELFGREKL